MTATVRTSATVLSLIDLPHPVLWFINGYIGSFFDRGPLCGWLALLQSLV
jgi:hypothetical protein